MIKPSKATTTQQGGKSNTERDLIMLNLQKLDALDLKGYEMTLSEAGQLSKLGYWEALHIAYKYGFTRGQNSIKNYRKRKGPGGAGTPTEAGPNKTTTILERTIVL